MISKKSIFLLFLSSVLFTLVFFAISMKTIENSDIEDVYPARIVIGKDELSCHYKQGKEQLKDISDVVLNENRRKIFFLETSCKSYNAKRIVISTRQACAVESAARMNPNMDVYVLYASTGGFREGNEESDRYLKLLKSYPNLHILHFDVQRFVKNTPVETLWTSGLMNQSHYPMVHTSDILRLLVLWRYGGIYLDLDVVVLKSLETFPDNFAGAQSIDVLANGVMGFSKEGKGHEYVEKCLENAMETFNGSDWAYNGPHLITRVFNKICPYNSTKLLIHKGRCEEFYIYSPEKFYLVPWKQWYWFFDKDLNDLIQRFADKESYLVHLWNKLSFNTTVPKDDTDVPYLDLARQYCPGVVEEIDEYF
ncbi:lactosylceramide 4-alpha-galactosyltransferase-like [Sitophilus oryzae]|uniref:Lactosylceramide 4-alpha-galactosyltransferase-like n=1 Tax=Sitophilus oryzae TaxID=7048 RepID=A0A6J2YAM9_SITOR|nr:lactosylceramide 4-alpha-galactosyltransferase-like [Sitophilus oryzae]